MAAHEEMCNEICVNNVSYRVSLPTCFMPILNSVTLYISENIKINITCYEATYSSQGTL